ncbi:MAG: DOMON-like domain-containing protein [Synechococcus sp.]|nr:DOMON-like domain-containing protein [Synechococcus sp.]
MARPPVMLRQASRLVPFERSVPAGLKVTAELIWSDGGLLELSFGVLSAAASGLADLTLPERLNDGHQPSGQRRDELWTRTCFEAFLGLPNQPHYWEINLAPNGDWAVYRFDAYREGQSDQVLSAPPDVRLQRRHHQLRLDARLDLKPWWPKNLCPELALTTVLDRGVNGISHWALRHRGSRADFHDRSTFIQG